MPTEQEMGRRRFTFKIRKIYFFRTYEIPFAIMTNRYAGKGNVLHFIINFKIFLKLV